MMELIELHELSEWILNWIEKNHYYHPFSKSNNIPIGELNDILNQIPRVDAEPVCRCEQCKWWDEDGKPDGRRWCYLLNIRLEPEFWCAYGEREEE